MVENQQQPESQRGGFVLVLLMLLVMSYPLSTGPVVLLFELGWLGPENSFWVWFYQPLSILANEFPLIQALFQEYMELWIQLA